MLSDNQNLLGRRGTSRVLPADVVFVAGTRNEEAFCLEEVPGRGLSVNRIIGLK